MTFITFKTSLSCYSVVSVFRKKFLGIQEQLSLSFMTQILFVTCTDYDFHSDNNLQWKVRETFMLIPHKKWYNYSVIYSWAI